MESNSSMPPPSVDKEAIPSRMFRLTIAILEHPHLPEVGGTSPPILVFQQRLEANVPSTSRFTILVQRPQPWNRKTAALYPLSTEKGEINVDSSFRASVYVQHPWCSCGETTHLDSSSPEGQVRSHATYSRWAVCLEPTRPGLALMPNEGIGLPVSSDWEMHMITTFYRSAQSENREPDSSEVTVYTQPLSDSGETIVLSSLRSSTPTDPAPPGPALSETGETTVSRQSSSDCGETKSPPPSSADDGETDLLSSSEPNTTHLVVEARSGDGALSPGEALLKLREPESSEAAPPEDKETSPKTPEPLLKKFPGAYCRAYEIGGGYVFRVGRGQIIAAATEALFDYTHDGKGKVIADEDLVAMEVHGRCRFMWDTSSFRHDAPREQPWHRRLHEQISGYLKGDGYFTDAAYVGYSMYAEGPVFARRRQLDCYETVDALFSQLREIDDVEKSIRGGDLFVEPGHQRAGLAYVPHYDAATQANMRALMGWVGGLSAEVVFEKLLPVGFVMEQANKNATDLANGRSLMPVTRFHALMLEDVPRTEPLEEQQMFPNQAEEVENPCLAELVCDGRALLRGCDIVSGFYYYVPCLSVLEYPDILLKMLRGFAKKYKMDRLTEKGMLFATHLWINITEDADLDLEPYARKRKEEGLHFKPVPAISLAECLIYYAHWLRWGINMGLAEFIHPFRFIRKAVETDLANNVNAGMEVKAEDIDEGRVRSLMSRIRTITPHVKTTSRSIYLPFMIPGSKLPPMHKLYGLRHDPQMKTAVMGLENVRFLGLPTYAPPPISEGVQRPTTFVLVQPKWATRRIVCQHLVKPYLEYKRTNPGYQGYKFTKRWADMIWKDIVVKTWRFREDEESKV